MPPIVPHHLFSLLLRISRTQKKGVSRLLVSEENDTQVPLEVRAVRYSRPDLDMRSVWKAPDLFEPVLNLVGTVEVDLAIVALRSAGACFARTGIKIPEVRVRAESRDEGAAHLSDGTEDLPFCVEPVSDPVGNAHLGE